MSRIKYELIGQKFNRLLIIGDSGERTKSKNVIWECLCECGNITTSRVVDLRKGRIKSCGCLAKETARKTMAGNQYAYKHGDSPKGKRQPLYWTWVAMKRRCHNPNDEAYRYYGKKGIKVCSEWRFNYSVFREWALQNGYGESLTIDRIRHDGNYEPNNCQWLTRSENSKKAMREKFPRV